MTSIEMIVALNKTARTGDSNLKAGERISPVSIGVDPFAVPLYKVAKPVVQKDWEPRTR